MLLLTYLLTYLLFLNRKKKTVSSALSVVVSHAWNHLPFKVLNLSISFDRFVQKTSERLFYVVSRVTVKCSSTLQYEAKSKVK